MRITQTILKFRRNEEERNDLCNNNIKKEGQGKQQLMMNIVRAVKKSPKQVSVTNHIHRAGVKILQCTMCRRWFWRWGDEAEATKTERSCGTNIKKKYKWRMQQFDATN